MPRASLFRRFHPLTRPLALGLLSLATVSAADWPQFRGPNRDGVYAGKDLATQWPESGPPLLWQKQVGAGFSGPVVAAEKVIFFSREADEEVVVSLNAPTGKEEWRTAYPTTYKDDFGFDPGPRATPCVADGRIFTLGAEGILQALNVADGKKIWRLDLRQQFQAPKGFFGIACSPMVEGNAVLINVGGRGGAGIVAFATTTGKVLWQASQDQASYSAPVAATVNGRRAALFLTRHNFIGLDPVSGRVWFEYPFGPAERSSVTAASPVVAGDLVFLSGCYGAPATVVRLGTDQPTKVWTAPDALQNHYATSVCQDGYLYGIDGRTDPGSEPAPNLRCVELATGKIRWQETSIGAATLTLTDGQLLVLTERGELLLAPLSPLSFKPTARAQIMANQVRAYPAIANGRLYARSKSSLVCVDLRAPK